MLCAFSVNASTDVGEFLGNITSNVTINVIDKDGNKLENDKAGSIYIKWKNKLPVIGFFFIIFIFLAINFNSAYSD